MRKGWERVALGSLCRFNYGKALPALSRRRGNVPVAGSSGEFDRHDTPNVGTDQSLIVGRKGTAGSVTWFDRPAWVTDTAYWVEPNGDTSLHFLRYLLEGADLPSVTAQTGVPGLNRDRVYEISVLRPPLPEQHRIVDNLGAVHEAIEAAEAKAVAAQDLFQAYLGATVATDFRGQTPLGDYLVHSRDTVPVISDASYPTVGVLNRGRGLLYRPETLGSGTSYKKLNVVKPGQVVYSRLKAFEGAITVVPPGDDTAFASAEFPSFHFRGELEPGYFRLATTRSELWESMSLFSKGMGGRRERLKPADFLSIRFNPPALEDQRTVMNTAYAIEEAARSAGTTAESLRALRGNLLTVLLSGEHEIPTSYDRLLQEA